jgi:hypothetical protein
MLPLHHTPFYFTFFLFNLSIKKRDLGAGTNEKLEWGQIKLKLATDKLLFHEFELLT